MAKPRQNEESGAVAEWLNTYADMVTLVLCFFVLLYSFSVVSETKWKQLVQSFASMYKKDVQLVSPDPNASILIPDMTAEPTPAATLQPTGTETPEFDYLYNELKNYVRENGLDASIDIDKNGDNINIRFKDTILFSPDSAYLRPEGKNILMNICGALRNAEAKIEMMRIEGHTAARPEGEPQFEYTFEMSVQRAVNVLKYMRDDGSLPPSKLSAVGYGQYHPIADNETEEGRIKNRRVEIIISKVSSDEADTWS